MNGYGLDGPGIESRCGEIFRTCPAVPGTPPAPCTIDSGSFSGVKSGRGVTMSPYLLLVPWSKKSRAIPLLPLWAVRPLQSLSACTRVHFTFVPSGKPKIHYLGNKIQVHIIPRYVFKIHTDIILPSRPRSFKVSPSLMLFLSVTQYSTRVSLGNQILRVFLPTCPFLCY